MILYVAAVFIFVARAAWRPAPMRPLVALLAFFLSLATLLGHLNGMPAQTYPFVPWNMYTAPTVNRSLYRLVVTARSGVSSEYPFSMITPGIPGPLVGYSVPSPVLHRLSLLARRCGCSANNESADRLLMTLERILHVKSTIAVGNLTLQQSQLDSTFRPGSWRTVYSWQSPGLGEWRQR